MILPPWVEWTFRIAGWIAWQLCVLFFAFVVYAGLFSEYGAYGGHPIVDGVAAVLFLLFALFVGTLPIRQWYAERRAQYIVDDHPLKKSDVPPPG